MLQGAGLLISSCSLERHKTTKQTHASATGTFNTPGFHLFEQKEAQRSPIELFIHLLAQRFAMCKKTQQVQTLQVDVTSDFCYMNSAKGEHEFGHATLSGMRLHAP
eukprot:4616790-Amphidinium_carterae.1